MAWNEMARDRGWRAAAVPWTGRMNGGKNDRDIVEKVIMRKVRKCKAGDRALRMALKICGSVAG